MAICYHSMKHMRWHAASKGRVLQGKDTCWNQSGQNEAVWSCWVVVMYRQLGTAQHSTQVDSGWHGELVKGR